MTNPPPPAGDLVERNLLDDKALELALRLMPEHVAIDVSLHIASLRQKLEEAEARGVLWCNQAQDFHADLEREHAALALAQSQRDNLLARIHRDGGHYLQEHGVEKACADADVIVADAFAQRDALAKAAEPFARSLRWEETEGAFAPTTDPESPPSRWPDHLSLYCVAWPGQDEELVSEDVMFTLGDLRALASARAQAVGE